MRAAARAAADSAGPPRRRRERLGCQVKRGFAAHPATKERVDVADVTPVEHAKGRRVGPREQEQLLIVEAFHPTRCMSPRQPL
jgi:hypothetical protein